MIGNMVDGAAAAMIAITLNVAFKTPCDYNNLMQAKNLCEDVVATDAVLSNIRTILLSADAVLKGIDREDVAKRNGALEAALSSIYNILLTPEGKPK